MNKHTIKIEVSEEFMTALANKIHEKNKMDPITQYYTVEQVAEKLNVGRQTIRNYCNDGVIVAKKSGKSWIISEHALYNYLNSLK